MSHWHQIVFCCCCCFFKRTNVPFCIIFFEQNFWFINGRMQLAPNWHTVPLSVQSEKRNSTRTQTQTNCWHLLWNSTQHSGVNRHARIRDASTLRRNNEYITWHSRHSHQSNLTQWIIFLLFQTVLLSGSSGLYADQEIKFEYLTLEGFFYCLANINMHIISEAWH